MKITEKTPHILSILLYPFLLRLCGVIFFVVGWGIFFYTLLHEPNGLPWYTLLFPFIGLCLFCASKVKLTLDKGNNTLCISIFYPLKQHDSSYHLSDIRSVYIEETSINKQPNYRVLLKMQGNEVLPLTYYYDPFLSNSITLAREIITFLDLKIDLSPWDKRNLRQTWLARGLFILGLTIIVILLLYKT